MMAIRGSWILLFSICLVLLGSCSMMAGDLDHWPASLPALAVMVAKGLAIDRHIHKLHLRPSLKR